jgi:dienelactone hydrolase
MLTDWFCRIISFVLPGLLSICAQTTPDASLIAAANHAPDLQFPSEPSNITSFDNPHMAVYKPEGEGPFPGIVLFHQCGGLGSSRRPNQSMLDWAKETVSHGYVALLIDSLGPRGVDTLCFGPKGGVNFPRGVKDALQAAGQLRKFSFVDNKRIALAGYSWGAMVGVLASGKHWRTTLAPRQHFDAVVSFYPGCRMITPPSGPSYEIVQPDIDSPLMVLMGEEDNETPPGECVTKLNSVKASDPLVEWHIYPGTTHCWDCKQLDGRSKVDARGNQITYRYNEDVTRDSARRMFEFLERTMGSSRNRERLNTN